MCGWMVVFVIDEILIVDDGVVTSSGRSRDHKSWDVIAADWEGVGVSMKMTIRVQKSGMREATSRQKKQMDAMAY
jgi:hypothetical protein